MLVHEILDLTVNSEIFARVLFLQNIAYAKFRENKILAKSLCRLLIYVNHALVANFSAARMSFNALLVNINSREISGFTVLPECTSTQSSHGICCSYYLTFRLL